MIYSERCRRFQLTGCTLVAAPHRFAIMIVGSAYVLVAFWTNFQPRLEFRAILKSNGEKIGRFGGDGPASRGTARHSE
jgi:hypothetical protein